MSIEAIDMATAATSGVICACGCGASTPLAPRTWARLGWTKGRPITFLPRHQYRLRLTDPRARFEAKIQRVAVGCWEWTGARNRQTGYGVFNAGQRVVVLAHRFSYELFVGPIPDGLQIDHLCRNRGCVRPDHLEPVTQRENVLRGEAPASVAYRNGTCERGHPRDGAEDCRICRRSYENARYRTDPVYAERKRRNARRHSEIEMGRLS